MLGLDNGVDQQRQPGGDRRRPGKVEVPCGRLLAALGQGSQGQPRHRQRQRGAEEQHPPPARAAGQHAPEQAPAGTPTEDTADQMARARSRADPSARSRSAEPAPPARSAPPPSPWPARAATSTPADGARPHANDPTANTTSPAMNTRRRPTRSAARPPSNKNPTKGQQIAVHDPLQAGLAEPEVALDQRQGHADDQPIQHHQKVSRGQHQKREHGQETTRPSPQPTASPLPGGRPPPGTLVTLQQLEQLPHERVATVSGGRRIGRGLVRLARSRPKLANDCA